jgi:hypothetical protein
MNATDPELPLIIADRGREVVLQRLRAAFAHQASARTGGFEIGPAAMDQMIRESADRAGPALWRIALGQAAAAELQISLLEALEHPAVLQALELIGAGPALPAFTVPSSFVAERPEPPVQPEPEADPEPETSPEPTAYAEPETDPEPEAYRDPWADSHAEESEGYKGYDDPEPEPPVGEPADAPWGWKDPVDDFASENTPSAEPPAGVSAGPQALRIAAIHVSGIESIRSGERDIELRLSDAGLDVIKRSSGLAIGRLDWEEIQTAEVRRRGRGLRSRRKPSELQVRTARGQAIFELPGLSDEELDEHLEPMLERLHSPQDAGSEADAGSDFAER